jgi:hypothetical protein
MVILLAITVLSLAGMAWILVKMFLNLMQVQNITRRQVYYKYIKRPICRIHIKTLRIQRHFSGENDPALILKHQVRDKVEAFSRYSNTKGIDESVMGSESFRTEYLKTKLLELRSNVLEYLPEGNGRLKPTDVFMLEIYRRELRMLGWTPEPAKLDKLWIKKNEQSR